MKEKKEKREQGVTFFEFNAKPRRETLNYFDRHKALMTLKEAGESVLFDLDSAGFDASEFELNFQLVHKPSMRAFEVQTQ